MNDQPDLSLDLRGEHCPYNAIATLEALADMTAGQMLEVSSPTVPNRSTASPKMRAPKATIAWQ